LWPSPAFSETEIVSILAAAILVATRVLWLAATERWWPERAPARPILRDFVWQLALLAWFGYWSWASIRTLFINGGKLAVDARIYYRGAEAWVHGGDPWSAFVYFKELSLHFAAPPPTVLLFAPFTVIPEQLFVIGFTLLSIASGVYLLRKVHLPIWWMFFPPLLIGMLSGNPVILGLACAVSGSKWLAPVAVAAKIYFFLPLIAEWRWRALVLTGVVMAASVVLFWPLWHRYLTEYSAISSTISFESDGGLSAMRSPILFGITFAMLGLLALIDFRAAGWLAMPALGPFTEFHTSTYALPLMSPILAIGLAVPRQGLPAEAICVYAAWRLARVIAPQIAHRLSKTVRVENLDSIEAAPSSGG
jgi:hypothetical protein